MGQGRTIQTAHAGEPPPVAGDYAILIHADSSGAMPDGLAPLVLDPRCRAAIAVGVHAEALHDAIDDVYLDAEVPHLLLTTWDVDPHEGWVFFIVSGAGAPDDASLVLFVPAED